MKNWLRIVFFIALFSLFGLTQAMAANLPINISIDYSKKIIRVEGRAEAGSMITVLVLNPHGSPEYINQTTSDNGGKYGFTFPASEEYGTYQISIGGTGSAAPYKTTYEYKKNVPDTPLIVSPTFPFTGKTIPELVVRSQAGTTIQVFEDAALIASAPSSSADTAFQLPPLGEGSHTLIVKALNAAGLASTEVILSLTIDTIAPKAPDVDVVRLGQSTVTGRAEPFSTVTVWRGNDIIGSVQTRADGTFAMEIEALSAETILTVVAKDLAGNESIATKVTVIPFNSSRSSEPGSVGAVTENNKAEMNFGANDIIVTTGTNGTSTAKVVVDPAKLDLAIRNLLASKTITPKLVLNVEDTSPSMRIMLPASELADLSKAEPAAVISVKVGIVSYDLPVSGLNAVNWAQQLGANVKDATVNVILDKVQGNTASIIQNQANRDGAKLLADPVDFIILVEAEGKRLEVKTFEGLYISRTFELSPAVSTLKTTGVTIDPITGEQHFVPTVFSSANGKTLATLKRNGNSIYSVVEYSKSFADTNAHWAQTDIELLASKRVVKGMTENSFAPDGQITRAEFAALLVRALGLAEVKDNPAFHDVLAGDWYSGAVAAAVKAGLVSGYDSSIFKPNDSITREQMAVMIANAGAYIKKQVDLVGQDDTLLSRFEDNSRLSPWAKSAIAQVVKAGIIQGMTDNSFVPDDSATRAQAVVMLKRFLQYAEFIN